MTTITAQQLLDALRSEAKVKPDSAHDLFYSREVIRALQSLDIHVEFPGEASPAIGALERAIARFDSDASALRARGDWSAIFAKNDADALREVLNWVHTQTGCTFTTGNEPCATCPKNITAMYRCGLMQDEVKRNETRG